MNKEFKGAIASIFIVLIPAMIFLAPVNSHAGTMAMLRVHGGTHYFTNNPCPESDKLLQSILQIDSNSQVWMGCWGVNTQLNKIIVAYPQLENPLMYDINEESENGHLIYMGEQSPPNE